MKQQYKNIAFTAACVVLSVGALAAEPAQADSAMVNVAFGRVAKADVVQAIAQVDKAALSRVLYSEDALAGVQGLVGGYNGNIWGQGPLVLVDGVPRSASLVKGTEVESVTIMKDAAAVALYGSQAAKGVVLITTKRGKNAPLTIDFRAHTGIDIPIAYPQYLDADCYMNLYNEACANDGKAPQYSQSDIYNTHMGNNIYRYPNTNYYSDDYLRSASFVANAVGEVYGGNEKTHYYVDFGMHYNNSLLKYGENKNAYDLNFNVRGNVDMTLAPWLKATTNAAVLFNNNYAGRGNFWGEANSMRPNWFAPLLPVSMMDRNVSSIDEYIKSSGHVHDGMMFGGTSANTTNAFAELLSGGYIREKSRTFMFDVALMADLSSITKGLSFRGSYSVDYTSYYSEAFAENFAVYQPTWAQINGQDQIVGLQKFNEDKKATNEYVGKSTYDQTLTFSAQFDYARTFGRASNFAATLLGWGYQKSSSADENHDSSTYHNPANVNAGLRLAYNWDHTYYVDFSGSVIHSARLAEGHREAFSPTLSAAWRISNEKFMKNVKWIDDLKISASAAKLHQDIDISDYYMYKGQYINNGGWWQWYDGSAGGNTAGSKRGENLELGFVTRNEFRVGIDATLWGKLITLNANYFTQKTNGLLTQGASTIYPSYFNNGENFSFLPWTNFNEDYRHGVDFTVQANKKIGQVDVTLGFNGMVFDSEAAVRDEVAAYDYQLSAGHALDTQRGLICDGIFQSQEEIDAAPKQKFGGDVKPGDLKYRDINADGVIDSNDQIDLGKAGWSACPFTYGINLQLKWKQFTLFAYGVGQSGAIGFKTNEYMRGGSKFTTVTLNRWTPETAATASYPRLTTTNGDNNYRNSTFWLYKTNLFRLSQLQLTYDFKAQPFGECFVKGLTVYAGANNLFRIASEKEYIETNYGSYPQTQNFYLGFKAQF